MNITKLEQGVKYRIKKGSDFCHLISFDKGLRSEFGRGMPLDCQYIGKVETDRGIRDIFYTQSTGTATYLMFHCNSLDYVVGKSSKIAQAEIRRALSEGLDEALAREYHGEYTDSEAPIYVSDGKQA